MAVLVVVLMLAFSDRFRPSKARMERYSWVSAQGAKILITSVEGQDDDEK